MLSLFSTKSDEAGFRLQYMEIYNWGTFDKEVYRITPKGNNSLLTGANGSGKTTYIDALLTLLVPTKKDRFYNQSSGVERKGDRNEESYLLGYYGNIQEEGKLSSTTQMLRNKEDYSVILANFSNKDQKTVTLFQVRWFASGVLKRSFGIAHNNLSIQQDFYPFDAKGIWKKRLSKTYNTGTLKKRIEFFNGPTDYAERMVVLFGMKSTKALSLFNQVVGIKLLGDLDEFIRLNMLEKRDSISEYEQLKESFITLMSAKNDIDKTKEQIKQLEPINDIAKDLKLTKESLEKLETEKEYAVYWFTTKGKELSEKQIKIIDAKLTICEEEIEKLETKKTELESKERDLSIQVESDSVGKQIKDLEEERKNLTRQRDSRKNKLNDYNELATQLNYIENPSRETFDQNRKSSKTEKENCKQKEKALQEDKRKTKNFGDDLVIKIQESIDTLKALEKNKNNISRQTARIRDEILIATGATKEEIPFIGELIKIDDSEKDWEASIEKVLHNFALQLIVPEKYYREVNEYVNNTNLRGLIVYQRYRGHTTLKQMHYEASENTLINKISFKPNNEYTDWIEDEIKNRFNFICSENLDDFNLEEKAITKQGLMKFGKGKHRKDDRKNKTSKENYVLGWDNKEKIQIWKKELKSFQKEQTENLSELTKIDSLITENEIKQEKHHDLYKLFSKFDDIDWLQFANQITKKNEQISALESANDKLKILKEQLNEVKGNLKILAGKGGEIEIKKKEQFNYERDIESINDKIQEYSTLLNSIKEPENISNSFQESHLELMNLKFDNFEAVQKKFQTNNQTQIKELEQTESTLKNKATIKISSFINPDKKIIDEYDSWGSDVSSLPKDIDFISEYQKMYKDLVNDGLVKFEKKFNNYLEDTITDKVGGFNMFFQNWSDDIKKTINSLNEALKEIEFSTNPKTYIKLITQVRNNDEIKQFKELLTKAIPDFQEIESSIDGKRIHFENNIAPFIKKLEDEKWRDKVMEVRFWFEYKAEEYKKSDHSKHKTYTGMGQLSGGEKAQLTYTILGAAIAYQFGLTRDGLQSNSFRFIAIDEAFKAQDEDKARYLIKLCQQLHLQLLVVTPSDNIHIVENDISFVHFVERKENRNSVLYDLPIEQFKEERKKFIVAEV